jgi:hypothetical protein
MLKPLTLSLSLAVALGLTSVSMAGHFASPQCPSPQGACTSPQSSCLPSPQSCLPKKHWNFHLPKPCFTYEWVLRKKMVWSCGNQGCNTCVMPSSQCAPSPQILGSSQAYPTVYGGIYGSGQYGSSQYGAGHMTAPAPAGEMTAPAPAPAGDEAPPAPEVAPAAPAPAPPAPSAPGPQSSLLFSTPSGN